MKDILNWIAGAEKAAGTDFFTKINPHDGQPLCRAARSSGKVIDEAVSAAKKAQGAWADLPGVKRGEILNGFTALLKKNREEIARIASLETGRSVHSILGETDGAISLGFFFAGEGQRLYGKTVASGVPNRQVSIIRQPLGVAALIIAANTPVANVAWKIFPALITGNSVVLKAAEDAPATAWIFGKIAREAGIPDGVLNIIQGFGAEAGSALVDHPDVSVVSFTGSTEVGRTIALKAAERFCRVSLELGGKNPLVVCDDADLENAVSWTILSAFGNAGQRCSAASRLIVFESVYDRFRQMLLDRTKKLKIGNQDTDDFGPLISERQLQKVLSIIDRAGRAGATIITGGHRLTDQAHAGGYYAAPTLIENVGPKDEISTVEVFGPVAVLHRTKDLQEALSLSNDSPYGLTAAIHTQNLNRAHWFSERVQAGIVSINGGTFGSEPHLPFGGVKQSGNGTREPGIEALNVYTELKNVCLNLDPGKI